MNCRGIGIFLCAAAVLCGCSVQKNDAKEENIRSEILAKIDMLKDADGLHIEETQSLDNIQQYFKDGTKTDEKSNEKESDTIRIDIALQNKKLDQYQVQIHPGAGNVS